MTYRFLIDTYRTEIEKVASVWSMFRDEDMKVRPRADDPRGRSPLEQMVHQCMSENLWFEKMFGIKVTNAPLPGRETRLDFIRCYTDSARQRLEVLGAATETWWEEEIDFFGVSRPRTWVMVRRIAHTAHHRGQLTTMLRALGRDLHSTYGPTADTGGLPKNGALTIYAYSELDWLVEEEEAGGGKTPLPGPRNRHPTERADGK